MVLGLFQRLQGPELNIETPWVPLQKTLYGANVIIFEGIMAFADKTLLEVRACWEHPPHRHPWKHSSFTHPAPTPRLPSSVFSEQIAPDQMLLDEPSWCLLDIHNCSVPLAN